MLNKNDPLIGAVQEVMKKNQAERDAVRLVNEKFGVTDRKALPHERQGEWDAAYKTVLTEGVEALDEAKKKSKLHPGLNTPESMKIRKIAGPGKVQYDPNLGVHIHDDLGDSVRKIRGFIVKDGEVKEIKGFVPGMREGVETLNELSPETLENYKNKRKTRVHAIIRNMKDWQLKKTPQGASDFIINSAEKAAKHAKMIKLAGYKIDGKEGVVAAKRPKKDVVPANRPKKRLEEEALDEEKIKMFGIPNKVKPKRGRLGRKDKDAIRVTNDLFRRMEALKKGDVKAAGNVTRAQIKKMQSEEALDEKLVGKQSNIDVASPDGSKKPDGKLTKHDFDALRASKNNTVKEAVMNKIMKKLKSVNEGAKVDRMVKHIKDSEIEAGKSPKEAERIAWATANKQGMLDNKNKKVNEGFNGRHGLSVTASAEKQVVAELYAVPGTSAAKAYSGALASNVGKPALPLQAGQRNLSPIGDSSRGRVRKTINRFVRKPLTVDDQAKAAAKTAFNTAMPDPQMSGSGRLRPEVSKFNKYKLPYISTNKSDSTALRPGAQRGDERPLTAQPKGPSFERSGRGSAPSLSTTPKTGPSTSLDAPARTAPSVVNKTGPSTSLDAPARTAPSVPPKAPNQVPPRQTGSGAPATSAPAQKPLDAFQRRAIERNPIGSSGRSLAPGGGSLGVTVRQPPSTTPRRPPGTGREK